MPRKKDSHEFKCPYCNRPFFVQLEIVLSELRKSVNVDVWVTED